jgi:hypothetical protein
LYRSGTHELSAIKVLSQAEIEFLKTPQSFAPKYSRALWYRIRKKATKLVKSELALLQQSGVVVTRNCCASKENCHASQALQGWNQAAFGEKWSLGGDLDPRPLPYQGNAPPG